MKNLVQAILAVMDEVKGIDKSMVVGTGNNSYKGVSDKDVKNIIGESMRKNGLVILPTEIKTKTEVSRWDVTYNGNVQSKQSIFTEVETKYLLIHTSGESMELSGYGHGVDSQDKGAGKATTYALKNTLLYSFLVPTGSIDDADKTHSDNIEVPKKQVSQHIEPAKKRLPTKSAANIENVQDIEVLKQALIDYGCTTEETNRINKQIGLLATSPAPPSLR